MSEENDPGPMWTSGKKISALPNAKLYHNNDNEPHLEKSKGIKVISSFYAYLAI